MKILSFNTGYFLGYKGTHIDYIKSPLKSLTGSKKEKDRLDQLVRLVKNHNPDIVLLQEVDGGSLRTTTKSQHEYLAEKMPERYSSDFGTKYRGTIYPRLPIMRFMGNSIFFSNGVSRKHSLNIGRKNLVQEIKTEYLSIFSLHLATFSQKIRRKQLDEIAKIARKRENYVMAGDLNLHKGQKEIDYLEDLLENPVHSPGETFPAENPSKKLDLVAASEGVKIKGLKDLGNHFSDHRPIIFEIES